MNNTNHVLELTNKNSTNHNTETHKQKHGGKIVITVEKNHKNEREACPAWGKICSNCNGGNHFENKCLRKKSIRQVNHPDEEYGDENNDQWLLAMSKGKQSRITAVMNINDNDVRFQVDSAADVNTICQRYVRENQVSQTTQRLTMWNNSKVLPLGEAVLDVTNPKSGETRKVLFTVVRNGFTNLLGVNTIQEMNLLTINSDNFIAKNVSKNL